jgi:DNA-binding transcriptional LysR family regulator
MHFGFATIAKPTQNETMQLQLDDIALFTRIAELGSLSAAARERDVPVSQVTRSLARLEAAVKARLLHRSTHGLSLTDEGDTLLAHGRRMLDTAAELAADLTGKVQGPSGWVRISASVVIAECLIVPTLPGLYARHPKIQIDINAEDRMADLARDGIDIAIRSGQVTSDTLVARHIGQSGRTLVASPAYLQTWGTPKSLTDLGNHRIIAHSTGPALNRWPLKSREKAAIYQVRGHTRTDNSSVLLTLVRQGVGMARLFDLISGPLIRQGELVPVLQDQIDNQPVPIFAVMRQERHRLPKIRACIDYWAESIAAMTPP